MATKFTYFNSKGLGELVRLLLSYGEIEFEDVRVDYDTQWPKVKSTTPFGQLPTFEENEKVTSQSIAIARYVARKVGLTGSTDWENLEIDAIVDTITDFRLKVAPLFYEPDETKKASMRKTFVDETIPFYFGRFEKLIAENNGHLVLKKLTWADFYLAILLNIVKKACGDDGLSKYPNILAAGAKTENLPNVKKWIEKRPVTEY